MLSRELDAIASANIEELSAALPGFAEAMAWPGEGTSPAMLSTAMESNTYHVQADWDPEANVWVATSDDVPGLATEAATIEELTARLRTMIPELLEANGLLPANVPSDHLAFELTSHRQELVTLAS